MPWVHDTENMSYQADLPCFVAGNYSQAARWDHLPHTGALTRSILHNIADDILSTGPMMKNP
jgi:hypothetical protein